MLCTHIKRKKRGVVGGVVKSVRRLSLATDRTGQTGQKLYWSMQCDNSCHVIVVVVVVAGHFCPSVTRKKEMGSDARKKKKKGDNRFPSDVIDTRPTTRSADGWCSRLWPLTLLSSSLFVCVHVLSLFFWQVITKLTVTAVCVLVRGRGGCWWLPCKKREEGGLLLLSHIWGRSTIQL